MLSAIGKTDLTTLRLRRNLRFSRSLIRILLRTEAFVDFVESDTDQIPPRYVPISLNVPFFRDIRIRHKIRVWQCLHYSMIDTSETLE